MGWNPFKKVTSTVTALAKNPTNLKEWGNLGLQTISGGQADLNGLNIKGGGINDLLRGKKSADINPDDIATQIRDTQTKGLGELNAALDAGGGGDVVRQGSAQQTKSVLTSAQDARRNAQTNMARMGMKGTSLGLASNRAIDQNTGAQVASINAALPGQIRDQALKDAQTRIGAGNINQAGMNFNTIEGQRSGGLLSIAGSLAPIAGQIAGGMMGGPAGVSAGGAAGSGLGSLLNPTKPAAPMASQGAYAPQNYSMGNYQF